MTCTSCNGTALDAGEPCETCHGALVAPCYWGHDAEADRLAPYRSHEDEPIAMLPMCADCATQFERSHRRQRAADDAEARGDYLCDLAKDDDQKRGTRWQFERPQ